MAKYKQAWYLDLICTRGFRKLTWAKDSYETKELGGPEEENLILSGSSHKKACYKKCFDLCNYSLSQLINGGHDTLTQRELNDELAKHNHPLARVMGKDSEKKIMRNHLQA